MRKIKKMLLCMMLLLSLTMIAPTQVEAAVKINKKTATLTVGKALQLKVSGTKSKVTWSSNKKSVATVTKKGKVTAKKKGTATITAKVGKKKYTCKVTVKAPAVTLSEKSKTLTVGQSFNLTLKNTNSSVKWTTSNKNVATIKKVSKYKYKVTGKKAGTATITAKVGSKKYSCKVTVEAPSLSSTKLSLTVGSSSTLKISGTSQAVTWKSSNTSVATVNSSGKVTAKAAGTAKITATVGGKKYGCKVTVKKTVEETFDATKAEAMINKKVVEANGYIYVFLESKYSKATDISAKCTFYDSAGNAVDYVSDSISYLEKGHCGVLQFSQTSVTYASYKIVYEYTEGLKYFYHKSIIDKLSVSANFIEYQYGDYLMLTVKNENAYDCYYCEAVVVYYDTGNNITGVSIESVGDIAANSEGIRKSYIPYDRTTYDDISYDRYEVFIAWGYHLGK